MNLRGIAAGIAFALLDAADAITMYPVTVWKDVGTSYVVMRQDAIGTSTLQVTAGGHFESNITVVDTFPLAAGCYSIDPEGGALAVQADPGNGGANVTVLASGGHSFDVGGAFCGLAKGAYECLGGRNPLAPGVTCRNAAVVLAGSPCNFMAGAKQYADVVNRCNAADLTPMTLYLVFAPAADNGGSAAAQAVFKAELIRALGVLLDLYDDAFDGVTVTKGQGYDLVAVEFTIYKTEELADVMARLTAGNLASLINMVTVLGGNIMLAAFGAVDAQGDAAVPPPDVSAAVSVLQLTCADGTAPAADGLCADGSTPTAGGTGSNSSSGGAGGSGNDDDGGAEMPHCVDGLSGAACVLVCNDGNPPGDDGKCTASGIGADSSGGGSATSGGLPKGAIAGMAIGCVVGVAIVVVAGTSYAKKRRNQAAVPPKWAMEATTFPMPLA